MAVSSFNSESIGVEINNWDTELISKANDIVGVKDYYLRMINRLIVDCDNWHC